MQNKTEMVKHLKEAYTKLPISIKDAKKLKAILLDTIPGDEANINLFVTTVTVGLVEEIASYENKKVPKQKKERWIKQLTEKRFIDRNIAIWAVECWCEVFGVECPKKLHKKKKEKPPKKDDNEPKTETQKKRTGNDLSDIVITQKGQNDPENSNNFKRYILALVVVVIVYIGYNRYIEANTITFKDKETGLIWQDDKAAKEVKKDWEGAKEYCRNLTLAGYDDWRLPSIVELRSIVDYDRYEPAIKKGFKKVVVVDGYWSSTSNVANTSDAWSVNFNYGNDGWNYKSYIGYVRCVRSGQYFDSLHFQRDDTREVVKDLDRELMWQDNKAVKEVKKDWEGAKEYCRNLTFAGYDDWRLPSIIELRSTVDYDRYEPAIKKEFKNVASNGYWSSTTGVDGTSYAWYVGFYGGNVNWFSKSFIYYVRCVRSGQ